MFASLERLALARFDYGRPKYRQQLDDMTRYYGEMSVLLEAIAEQLAS